MKRFTTLFFFGVSLSLCPHVIAAEKAPSLRVVMLPPGDHHIGFTATLRMQTTADAILAVFDDVDVAEKWVYRSQDHALVKSVNFSERYTYQHHNLPWPASDRDVVLHHRVVQLPGEKNFRIVMKSKSGLKKQKNGVVRIPFVRSVYDIRTQTDGWVKVTWTHRFDPGGTLPKSLAKPYLKKLAQSMTQLAKLVQHPRFSIRKLHYRHNTPVGFRP